MEKKIDWKSESAIAQLTKLWFVDGLKDAAIAERMGCTPAAIRSVRGRLAEVEPERGWTDATRVKAGTQRAERIAARSGAALRALQLRSWRSTPSLARRSPDPQEVENIGDVIDDAIVELHAARKIRVAS
jgi:hypothetical protein